MSQPCILIVEDEAVIARDIQATLVQLGYLVPPPVASCEEALEAVLKHRPDLILMDIRIQGDVDGIETGARIRDAYGTPLVYLTSYSDATTMATAKAGGAAGYLLKPFRKHDLEAVVSLALQKRSYPAGIGR
ncbi:MAG: response regulator [Myxococcales bacterium]